MSKLQTLRGLMRRRLTEAVEEIFTLLERTVTECEEELERRSGLLREERTPPALLLTTDVDQLLETQQIPSQTEQTSVVDPTELQPMTEDQKGGGAGGEQLHEAEMMELPSVSVRREGGDEEEDQGGREPAGGSSFDYVISDTEGDGCPESEPDCGSDPDINVHPCNVDEIQELLKVERAGRNGWKKTREPQLSFISLNDKVFFKLLITTQDDEDEDRKCKTEIKCPMCPKRLSSSRSLKAHMRCHTGEEPYSCSFCGKRFKWNADCASHMRVHTGERPFVCQICGKGYTKSSHLRQHVRGHGREKPFHCTDCDRRFVTNYGFKHHKCTASVQTAQCEVKVEISE